MTFLEEYDQRTTWKTDALSGTFHTHPSLSQKVGSEGHYLPFPGTTAALRCGKRCTQIIQLMQEMLHAQLQSTGILAERLPEATLHMTLHDMICPEHSRVVPKDLPAGEACADTRYLQEMQESIEKGTEIAEKLREQYAPRQLILTADRIVSMVSKSIVLLLRPKTEEDASLLMNLYQAFDAVTTLPYPLTPHITLAYYRPGQVNGDLVESVLHELQVERETLDFTFPISALTVQRFRDMKAYYDVPQRICFVCDGGLNRSQMAAAMVNQMAMERKIPVLAEARSAYQNTEGERVPLQVSETLLRHGYHLPENLTARYLEESDYSAFTSFYGVSYGAVSRLQMLRLPQERIGFYLGVPDPAYECSHEEAFQALEGRMKALTDDLEGQMMQVSAQSWRDP